MTSPRPSPTRKPANYPPRLLADLDDTLKTGQSLGFPVDGLDPKAITRLAARLNAVGRRGGVPYSVRTRRADGVLYAWAVPKQARTSRTRKPAPAVSETD